MVARRKHMNTKREIKKIIGITTWHRYPRSSKFIWKDMSKHGWKQLYLVRQCLAHNFVQLHDGAKKIPYTRGRTPFRL